MQTIEEVAPGADSFLKIYKPGNFSSIAVVAHAGSVLQNGNHLVDEMLDRGFPIQFVYAPEHGFRSREDAGAKIADGRDAKTGLPVKSLYGQNRKPKAEDIAGLDAIIFDLQDVGTRFYTYLSTLKYLLEACAEEGIPIIVLDRPNPNGFYVDGPVLDTSFQSFVGIIPIPIVHGMTLGELASLMAGERIANPAKLDLRVIPCDGYERSKTYMPPVPPSPNLPTIRSILLYPHLCYFEATSCTIGRGTNQPFELVAHPKWKKHPFQITPLPGPGATAPKHQGKTCYGKNLNSIPLDSLLARSNIDWSHLLDAHREFEKVEDWVDRPEFMNLLMGTDQWKMMFKTNGLQKWIKSYESELQSFLSLRERYLIYD
ncbi:MAG: DUF1343 domain-containing protein [Bacteroidetes bacterium]|nr:DUF1343 domain-containing protein [Bacteroidota bacterium]